MYLYEILKKKSDYIDSKASIKEALKKMVDQSLSYLSIVDDDFRPVGIITERDIASIYFNGIDFNREVADYFIKLIVKTTPDRDIDFAISLMIDYQIRRVVVIDKDGKYLGVVEHSDLVFSLENDVFKVDLELNDILDKSREALGVNVNYNLKDAFDLIHKQRRSAVLVFDKKDLVGILTEKDITKLALERVDNKAKIIKYMHSPVKCVDYKIKISDAVEFLQNNKIRHLVTKKDNKYYVVSPDSIIKNLKGNYVKFLEDKIRSHRKSLDDLGYIFIELIDLDGEQIVQYANKNAREVLDIEINERVEEFIPKNIWLKSLEAFSKGINIELDNVKIGTKFYKYIAVKSRFQEGSFHTINIILVDIDKFHKKNIELSEKIDEIGTASNRLDIEKREIFNQNAIGIGYISLDGNLLLVNNYMLNLLGYKANEIIGRSIFDFTYKDDIELTKNYLKKILLEFDCNEIQIEKRYLHKRGFPVWVSLSLYVSRNENKMPRYFIGFVKDIRERKKIELEQKRTNKILKEAAKVFDNSTEAICILDKNRRILNINDAFKNITKFNEREILGRDFAKLFFLENDIETIKKEIEKKSYYKMEKEGVKKDGSKFPILLNISSVTDLKGEIENYVVLFSDISAIKSTEKKLEYLANHDTLTGLPNRFFLLSNMEQVLKRAKRNGTKVAVIFLDLDKFKPINDSFGHDYGDEILKNVSKRLRKILREKDIVARIGGDEFIVVIEDIADIKDTEFVIDKIFSIFDEPFSVLDRKFTLGCSFGISFYPDDGNSMDELIKNSDIAMYEAKKLGGRGFNFYSRDYYNKILEKINIENEIEKGIQNNEFFFTYQPQMSCDGSKILGVEALIRWNHPKKGIIYPDSFLPLAEESGLMISLGKYILQNICRQMVDWSEKGISLDRFSVNISYKQLKDKNFYRSVTNIIRKTGVNPNLLDFELTERYLMDETIALKLIKKLKKLGISVSLDDFGMGYSSLNSLKELPIDRVKIDKNFLKYVPNRKKDVNLFEAMISLGNSLKLDVIVEGVERKSQLEILKDKNIYAIQGFIYSRPLSVSNFEKFYQKFSK